MCFLNISFRIYSPFAAMRIQKLLQNFGAWLCGIVFIQLYKCISEVKHWCGGRWGFKFQFIPTVFNRVEIRALRKSSSAPANVCMEIAFCTITLSCLIMSSPLSSSERKKKTFHTTVCLKLHSNSRGKGKTHIWVWWSDVHKRLGI